MKRSIRLSVGLVAILVLVVGAAWWVSGCASMAKMATEAARATGNISDEEATSLNRSIDAVEKYYTDVTPEQEYYIGRAVTAQLLSDYKPLKDQVRNTYLNEIGQTLAMASDRPETFGGYHFLMLDTDEINAFAAPGGLILVSRGMVELCQTEDELAAVLAHEIGHVLGKHGLRAIESKRLTSALTVLGTEGLRTFGGEQLKQLVADYEGSVNDVVSTLSVNGYSRSLEEEADQSAVVLLERVGYNPKALTRMLSEMAKHMKPGGPGFARTHPDPNDRIDAVSPALSGKPNPAEPRVRHERFVTAVRR